MAGGDDGGRVDGVGLVHGRYLVLTGDSRVLLSVYHHSFKNSQHVRSICYVFGIKVSNRFDLSPNWSIT